MKQIKYLAVALLFLLILILFGSVAEQKPNIDAEKGQLDLRGWSNEKNGNLWVDGEWEFYWEKLLTKDQLQHAEPDLYAMVPQSWNHYKIDGKKLPSDGYATYHLHVISNLAQDELMALQIKNIASAYDLYIDDKLIAESGTVGKSKAEEKGIFEPKVVTFNVPGKEFDLILQVSNHQFSQSGIWYGVFLGDAEAIYTMNNASVGREIFILGAACILAIFNLIIFILRRDLKYALYFSICSVLLGIVADTFGQLVMMHFYPFSAQAVIYLWDTSGIWSIFFFNLFLANLYRSDFSRIAIKIYLIASIISQLFYTFVDTTLSSKFAPATITLILLGVLTSLTIVIIGIRNGEKEAWLQVASIFVVTIGFVHDIMYWSRMVESHHGELLFPCIFIFLILQIIVEAKRIKQSNEEKTAAELVFLQAQIKPHFLFNALNTIVSVSRYDSDGARKILMDLSSYLRRSFDFKDISQTVPLKQELELVQAYINIEKVRFQERLEVNLSVSEEFETKVPILVLQPIIENAVNHGVLPKQEGGRIDITVKRQGTYIVFCVKDNGIGFDPREKQGTPERKYGSGVGLANVNSRLISLYGKGLQVSSELGVGTEITWRIPIDRKELQNNEKAVLIDDERPALMELEYLLKKYEEITVAGLFSDPLAALEAIKELKPQVVFLDIHMPQLGGIDAASLILDIDPAIDIIFVTAYDQYALEAFDLHALDYILKPINMQRFDKTIKRVLDKSTVEKDTSQHFVIKCLGGFQVGWKGKDSIKWRADKTKEIFAYLLQNKEKDISKDELLDRLWPEDDPEKAIRQLYNGIYYIRKALEDYGVGRDMIKIDKDYRLKLSNVDLDVNSFYDYGKNKKNYSLDELEKLADRYGGDYLQGEYYPWADFEREHLEQLNLKCISQLSAKLMEEQQWDKAEEYLLKAYGSNPYEEEISEKLVELYIQSGNKSKAIRHYNIYAELILKELGVKPEAKLQSMIKNNQ